MRIATCFWIRISNILCVLGYAGLHFPKLFAMFVFLDTLFKIIVVLWDTLGYVWILLDTLGCDMHYVYTFGPMFLDAIFGYYVFDTFGYAWILLDTFGYAWIRPRVCHFIFSLFSSEKNIKLYLPMLPPGHASKQNAQAIPQRNVAS